MQVFGQAGRAAAQWGGVQAHARARRGMPFYSFCFELYAPFFPARPTNAQSTLPCTCIAGRIAATALRVRVSATAAAAVSCTSARAASEEVACFVVFCKIIFYRVRFV